MCTKVGLRMWQIICIAKTIVSGFWKEAYPFIDTNNNIRLHVKWHSMSPPLSFLRGEGPWLLISLAFDVEWYDSKRPNEKISSFSHKISLDGGGQNYSRGHIFVFALRVLNLPPSKFHDTPGPDHESRTLLLSLYIYKYTIIWKFRFVQGVWYCKLRNCLTRFSEPRVVCPVSVKLIYFCMGINNFANIVNGPLFWSCFSFQKVI